VGNTCCGSALALSDAGCVSDPNTQQVVYTLPDAPIGELSGGNVQRAILARELSGEVQVLVAANPCFGLDFKAVDFIHNLLVETRNKGAAVLLISEDLDELLSLADRIFVMTEGTVAHETVPSDVDLAVIGRQMAGHH